MKYQFGLIGYPISHSLSPWIHNHFMKQVNIEGTYSIFEINPNDSFSEELNKLKEKGINGFNVTVPYKEKIISFLDEIDDQAKHIGAVNTVLCKDNKWIGYNTDGIGYVRSLLNDYPHLINNKDVNILILGAGGAAKGIFHALMYYGFKHLTFANRSVERAESIAKTVPEVKVKTLEDAEKDINAYQLIIQTTSVGMKPHNNQSVISINGINKKAIVSDIVYQPLMTKLLKEAKQLGASVHLGHTMLLYQAQYAFEIWTNEQPNAKKLNELLKIELEG